MKIADSSLDTEKIGFSAESYFGPRLDGISGNKVRVSFQLGNKGHVRFGNFVIL